MRIFAIFLFVVAGLSGAPARANPAQNVAQLPGLVQIGWKIVERDADTQPRPLAKNSPLFVGKAVAQNLFVLDAAAQRQKGRSAIPAGTVFAKDVISAEGSIKVLCEPGRRKGQDTIACLADRDGDGAYDHYGSVQTKMIGYETSTSIGFLAGLNTVRNWMPLLAPVKASAHADGAPGTEMTLQLTLTSLKGGWVGRGTLFSLCVQRDEGKNIWGGAIVQTYCAQELVFDKGPGQLPFAFVGSGGLTLTAIDETQATIILDAPAIGAVF